MLLSANKSTQHKCVIFFFDQINMGVAVTTSSLLNIVLREKYHEMYKTIVISYPVHYLVIKILIKKLD